MKRIAKRRLSCLLSAILLLVMSLDMSAFAGVFEKTARKIDVWDFGGVAESNTEMYQNNISAQTGTIAVMLEPMRSLMQQALSLAI